MEREKITLEEIAQLKRENPQWFDVMRKAAQLPDDKLHELVEYVTAIINSKETANR